MPLVSMEYTAINKQYIYSFFLSHFKKANKKLLFPLYYNNEVHSFLKKRLNEGMRVHVLFVCLMFSTDTNGIVALTVYKA